MIKLSEKTKEVLAVIAGVLIVSGFVYLNFAVEHKLRRRAERCERCVQSMREYLEAAPKYGLEPCITEISDECYK